MIGKVAIKKGAYNDPVYGPTRQWWDQGTVAQPQYSQLFANGESGMFGNMGRNMLTGPGRNNFDLALEKNFQTPWFRGEHGTVQFRLETFNTFNHTHALTRGATEPRPWRPVHNPKYLPGRSQHRLGPTQFAIGLEVYLLGFNS